tara:strand:- start:247 stop:357 length:111 start_codon:yes stop_codon:yes gene_type:complete
VAERADVQSVVAAEQAEAVAHMLKNGTLLMADVLYL